MILRYFMKLAYANSLLHSFKGSLDLYLLVNIMTVILDRLTRSSINQTFGLIIRSCTSPR